MATVSFLLQKPYIQGTNKVLNPLETRLYAFLIVNRGNVVKIKTEHSILPKDWDFRFQKKKEIKESIAGSIEENKKIMDFNESLVKLKNQILANYQKIVKENPDEPFSKISEQLKDFGKSKELPFLNNTKDFFSVMDEFLLYLEGEVTPGTIKKFKTLKLNLQEFGKENKKYQTITFSTINHAFEDAYKKYLRNQAPRGRQKTRPEGEQYGLLNATIGKYIECLKTFCKWATKHGHNTNLAYLNFETFTKATQKTKKQDHDIVTLSLQELKQFYTHDFSDNPTFDRVRDLFCFGAYTGQRWSDIERFDKLEIHGDVWSFTAFKTKKETEIDLIGYAAPALDILKKYNYQLPKISLQKFNFYLKKAAEKAEINTQVKIRRYVGVKEIEISKPKHEFIGSHTARKTCVSILLNNFNLSVSTVLQITGHSKLSTLQKYINTDRAARREALSKTKSFSDSPLTIVKSNAV